MLQRNIVKIDLNPECACLRGGGAVWGEGREREGGKKGEREHVSRFITICEYLYVCSRVCLDAYPRPLPVYFDVNGGDVVLCISHIYRCISWCRRLCVCRHMCHCVLMYISVCFDMDVGM